MERISRYCMRCNAQVPATRHGTNHLLHLLLTGFTGGLWLIVWFVVAIRTDGWRCTRCGVGIDRM